MSATDPFGNPVTVSEGAARAAVDDFVEGLLACETRVQGIAEVARADDSALVQAYAAMLEMFAERADAPGRAAPHVARAVASAESATARERRFVAAVAAWIDGDLERAIALHEEQSRLAPRDLVSVKLGQYHAFNLGDAQAMLRLALQARAAAADLAWAHGLAAFGYEQCHRLDEAAAAATEAISIRRKEPWAHHALAHVLLTRGTHEDGHAFMREMSGLWTGLNSFMVTHNWWHLALFSIARGDLDEALDLYDTQVWGVCPEYSQDQIGAVSLLARLELAGVEVGGRWAALQPWLEQRVDDHVQPFLVMHYAYGLARCGSPAADRLLESLERFALGAPRLTRDAWLRVCLPACRGLVAYARGRFADATAALESALPRLARVGGSHAQRALFEQILDDARARDAR
ncbi:MAG: tetratricopeptide repeat protein [Burkholderiales bacterium]|nr:MAG: tetratricopeptide repeat protein [Burkholderiales bacterium]